MKKKIPCPFCGAEYPRFSIKYHFCKIGHNRFGYPNYVSNMNYWNAIELDEMKKDIKDIKKILKRMVSIPSTK